jgi:hypothetical protein
MPSVVMPSASVSMKKGHFSITQLFFEKKLVYDLLHVRPDQAVGWSVPIVKKNNCYTLKQLNNTFKTGWSRFVSNFMITRVGTWSGFELEDGKIKKHQWPVSQNFL